MEKVKQRIVILFCIFLFISCKTTFDFSKNEKVVDVIEREITEKKVVCVSEHHSDVFPLELITENLEKFYEAGLRYIFLEEQSDNFINNPKDINYFIYPPWESWGYRYEYILFEKEILRINNLHKNDPLVVIWPETGLEISEDEFNQDLITVLNIRDEYAQANIIGTIKGTEKKSMIVYGNMHGEIVSDDIERKSLGKYLFDYFGDDFSSFNLVDFKSDGNTKIFYGDNDCKIVETETIRKILKDDSFTPHFTHYGFYEKEKYGVPIFYIPEKMNLDYLIKILETEKISEKKEVDVWSKKSEQLLAIYYLKYHFGNNFSFDYTQSEDDLANAINKIKEKNNQDFQYNLEVLEEYIGVLTNLMYARNEEELTFLKNEAKKINQNDIWPLYWYAYFMTNAAESENSISMYKHVLTLWDELFNNDLLYASPVLKLSCQKAAFCAGKIGNKEKTEFFREIEKKINPVFDIDYEKYEFFGW